MSAGDTTLDASHSVTDKAELDAPPQTLALVLVWTASEPHRLGEALLVEGERPLLFGRGDAAIDDGEGRIDLVRQRPGRNEPASKIENPFVSRVQLRIQRRGDAVSVVAVGKRPLRVAGGDTDAAELRPGDVFEIKGLYAFLCVARPLVFPAAGEQDSQHVFGQPDPRGLVGESAASWKLRAEIMFSAGRAAHVLIMGASGTGKELVAQAIHASSARAGHKLVARNAATFPAGLIDAELYGNVANYPNAGMPERPGLIGQADGSTLFLDELGELPGDLQAHLLRVMDAGDYQRLGEARRRNADIRFIAATNRPVAQLKHDLLARFVLRVQLPGLAGRREDIPLLARHLLGRIAAGDPQLGQRFFSQWNGSRGEPRLAPDLACALVVHEYATHTRELEAVLWRALSESRGAFLELGDGVRDLLQARPAVRQLEGGEEVTADQIRRALARHGGVKDRVWRDLGLPSRHVLRRLIQKHGIEGGDADERE